MQAVSSENDRLHEQIAEASQSVAQSWPLKTFAYRNPLRGLEHLPFDEAIRQGKKTLVAMVTWPTKTIASFTATERSPTRQLLLHWWRLGIL